MRGQFANVAEMNECIITEHNKVVRPGDHVYMLGDVCMRKSGLDYVKHMHGRKRLVRGNHDIYRTKQYLDAGFEEIHGCRVLNGMVLTHMPVHPESIARFVGNVHGHIHTKPTYSGPYLNVGVEVLNYTPITIEDAHQRLIAHEVQTTGVVRPVPVRPHLVEEIELLTSD